MAKRKKQGPIVSLGKNPLTKLAFYFLCYIVPAFLSAKAFKNKNLEEEKIWLKYWLIITVFIKLDEILYRITRKIPFWIFIKFAILIFFQFINRNSISYVYENTFKHIYDEIFPKLINILNSTKAVN